MVVVSSSLSHHLVYVLKNLAWRRAIFAEVATYEVDAVLQMLRFKSPLKEKVVD